MNDRKNLTNVIQSYNTLKQEIKINGFITRDNNIPDDFTLNGIWKKRLWLLTL